MELLPNMNTRKVKTRSKGGELASTEAKIKGSCSSSRPESRLHINKAHLPPALMFLFARQPPKEQLQQQLLGRFAKMHRNEARLPCHRIGKFSCWWQYMILHSPCTWRLQQTRYLFLFLEPCSLWFGTEKSGRKSKMGRLKETNS